MNKEEQTDEVTEYSVDFDWTCGVCGTKVPAGSFHAHGVTYIPTEEQREAKRKFNSWFKAYREGYI